jgi:kinesin family protein 15
MKEDENEVTQIVQVLSPNTVMVVDKHFTFDVVENVDSTQKDIFEMVGLPLVENCMEGFNSSIFAYGQTGSGKTYTMWGLTYDSSGDQFPNKDWGLTPHVFEQLFCRIEEEEAKNIDKQLRYLRHCSFLEIYNEQITDLREPNQRNLQNREDTKTGVYVENLTRGVCFKRS